MQPPSPVTITVIKPYNRTNAVDHLSIVHYAYSFADSIHLCTTRCGLVARWSHASETRLLAIVAWTKEDPSCMTCIVMEARCAAA